MTAYDNWKSHDRHGGDEDDAGEVYPAASLCLCGDLYNEHKDGVSCEKCAPCDRFVPSPYSCPVCGWPATTAMEAMQCCICACTHRREKHQTKSAASITKVNTRCQSMYCGCPGFGGVASVVLEATAVVAREALAGGGR